MLHAALVFCFTAYSYHPRSQAYVQPYAFRIAPDVPPSVFT
jgi:hypothetical protein